MRHRLGWLLLLVACLLGPALVGAQTIGDRVLLVERALGIPGHPNPGNPGVSHRFAGGTTVTVLGSITRTAWYEVRDAQGLSAGVSGGAVSVLTDLEPFVAAHRTCGPIWSGANEPTAEGYRAWAGSCTAIWTRWVTEAEAVTEMLKTDLPVVPN